VVTEEEDTLNDASQAQPNVDSDQVSTQNVAAAANVPPANEGDAGTPVYDGLQEPKGPEDEEEQPVASHNVFEQNQTAADGSVSPGVYAVDGDNPASIDEALRKHHEAHGA
jgi:hypothetical protein